MKSSLYIACCLSAVLAGTNVAAQERSSVTNAIKRLESHFQRLVSTRVIVGAQLAIARDGRRTITKNFGVVAAGSRHRVDSETLFLIGSCSKPFASACVLSLIDDPDVQIQLADEIDRWIPAYASAKTTNGGPAPRAPTVEELLAHRSGIYSQNVGMTQAQTMWIRRFTHSLSDAVEGISRFDLIARPGQTYAYSGAGYCVLGRVAELASGQPFETILQQRLCEPLGLTRTTYFPARTFGNEAIATGSMRNAAPHLLGSKHRMPLIGGSLYSTADEMSQFARAIMRQWNNETTQGTLPVSRASLEEITRPRSPNSGYSLGWKVEQNADRTIRLSHSGSLQSYRARLVVDLDHGRTIAACWTLASDKQPPGLARQIDEALSGI